MGNVNAIQTILAREAGRITTPIACKRLSLTIKDLLALRRRLLESALGVRPLPPLTAAEVERALLSTMRTA